MKVVVTGADGLLAWHAAVRLHARNAHARYRGVAEPFDVVRLNRAEFQDPKQLQDAVYGADAVLHFAGVNRGANVEEGNPQIAKQLIKACQTMAAGPHIIYANSTHAAGDTPYGRSKAKAGAILAGGNLPLTNLVLPHIFGECARPNYNNVTATFIAAVISGEEPKVDSQGQVSLLHAGEAAEISIQAALKKRKGIIQPDGRRVHVPELLSLIRKLHADYSNNIFPNLQDPFVLALFNTYRAALYPDQFPRILHQNVDSRGSLFEAVKGGGGGQTFLSWTEPGVTRGNHFHLGKVERFLVLQGEAKIRIRKVLGDDTWEYRVSGTNPAPIDMPTMHTHNIQNVGQEPLLTLFWTHELFDSTAPDTYADAVEATP